MKKRGREKIWSKIIFEKRKGWAAKMMCNRSYSGEFCYIVRHILGKRREAGFDLWAFIYVR